ncbi:uncharacterized protein [Oscarella lobularis]|uniref:uncharacterized protein isoform X2 n=1 Tax=Oscarella lobularis TaxID=121494 RepID=UPI003313D475
MAIKKVFVGNLGNVVSDETLRRAFQDYGEIIDVLLIEDKQTGFKSYGFVTFRNTKAAEDAINALQHTILNGRRLTVQMAKSEHEKEHYRGRRSPGGYYHHRHHRSRSRSPHGERGGWGRGRDRRREWAGDGYDESEGAWDAYGGGGDDGRRYREHERNPRRRAWEDDRAGVAAAPPPPPPPRRRESRWNRESDDGGGPFSGANSRGAEFPNHHRQQQQHSYDDWGAPAPIQGDYGKDDYRYHLTARREVDQFKAFHQQIHSKPLPQPHHHQDQYRMSHDSQQQQQQQQHQSQFHHHHQQQQSRQSDDDVPYRRISVDEDPYVMDDFVQGRFSHESPDNSRYDATRRQQPQQQVQQQSYSRQQLPVRQAPPAFDYTPAAAAAAKESEYVPKKRKYYQEEGTDVYGQAAMMKKLPSAQPPAANRQDAYKLSSSSLSSRQTPAAAAAAAAAVAAAVSQYSHSQDQDWGDYRQRETQTGNSYYRSADPRTRSAPANSSSVDSALMIASLRSRRLGNELQSSQAKPATAVTKPSSAWDQAVTAATTSDYAAAKSRLSSRWSPPPSSRAAVADYSPQQQQQQQQQVPSQQRTTSRSYQYEQPAERDSGVASQIRSSVTNRPSDVYEGYSPTRPQIYSSGATRAVASASQSTPSPSLSALAGSAYDPRVYPTSTAASLRLSGGARSTDVQSSASLARSSYAEAYQPKSTSLAGSSYAGSSAASSRVLASSGVTPSYWSSQSLEKSYEGGTSSSGASSVKARSSTENTREPIRFGFVGGERDASSSAYSSYSSFRQGKSS